VDLPGVLASGFLAFDKEPGAPAAAEKKLAGKRVESVCDKPSGEVRPGQLLRGRPRPPGDRSLILREVTPPMNRFAVAHSASAGAREAADECARHLGAIAGPANLGFVYASDQFASQLEEILTRLRARSGVPHWVGSVGVGISAPGTEYHEQPALSVMTGAFPEGSFRVFHNVASGLDDFLAVHGDWIRTTGCRFGMVHGDPRNPMVPELVTRLAAALNDGFLVGGLTSSRGDYAQVADHVTSGGISGVLFSPEVSVATHLTQSCLPFGETHEVTECERNIVVSLDHRPALDVFAEEIGEILSRDLEQAARYIGAALPVAGSDRGDYLVRNVVGFDPGNRLLAVGEVLSPGQLIRFCRRDPVGARADLKRMLLELRERAGPAPRGGVYFSCLGRGQHLFGADSAELKSLQEVFGDLPLVGFFCNGEISCDRLYGYTGVLSVFK